VSEALCHFSYETPACREASIQSAALLCLYNEVSRGF
jgi:hypothetical protein